MYGVVCVVKKHHEKNLRILKKKICLAYFIPRVPMDFIKEVELGPGVWSAIANLRGLINKFRQP